MKHRDGLKHPLKKQQGLSTLMVVLLLLLAITLPGIAIMRSTTMHEQMSASSVDRARTFQAAEAGLIEAETFAATKPEPPASGCSAGICAIPQGTSAWKAANFWSGTGSRQANVPFDGIRARYAVEFLGVSTGMTDDCTTGGDVSPDAACDEERHRYRITVFSRSPTGSEVILQSNFLAP